jgi:D-alanine-D-alanine ligase-like ATP-grasp enzyme
MGFLLYSRPVLAALRFRSYSQELRQAFFRRRAGFDGDSSRDFYRNVWRRAAMQLCVDTRDLPGGFLEMRSGQRVTRVKEWLVMLDDPVTLSLAGNKVVVNEMLKRDSLPVPNGLSYTLSQMKRAWYFLRCQDVPCVVKPVSETGGGHGVTTGVETQWQLVQASARAANWGRELLIERQVDGENYRLLYLDGVLIDALHRGAPTVVGDGRSSIRQLIRRENLERVRNGRAVLGPITIDLDCRSTLFRAGLSLRSVPAQRELVRVKTATNESSERDNETVFKQVGPSLVRQGARAAEIVGARLAGVDVITKDLTLPLDGLGVIVEVNTTPGIKFHYMVRNPDQGEDVAVPILRRLLGLGMVER